MGAPFFYDDPLIIQFSRMPLHGNSFLTFSFEGAKDLPCSAVGLLKQGKFIEVDDNGFITLTESGRSSAQKILDRHTILTSLLTKLGVAREVAAKDAFKMEHSISDETIDAIKSFLES